MTGTVVFMLTWFGLACLLYWALGRGKALANAASYPSVLGRAFVFASLAAPGFFGAGHTLMPAPAGIAIVIGLVFFPQTWETFAWNGGSVVLLGLVFGLIARKAR